MNQHGLFLAFFSNTAGNICMKLAFLFFIYFHLVLFYFYFYDAFLYLSAIEINALNFIELLVKCESIDINRISKKKKLNPISFAVQKPTIECFSALIKHPKLDLNSNISNPLIHATKVNNLGAIHLLIQHGANPNVVCEEINMNCYQFARQMNFSNLREIIKLFDGFEQNSKQ